MTMNRNFARLLAAVLAVVLCVASLCTIALAANAKATANLNKRKTPSTSATKLGLISKGSSITVKNTTAPRSRVIGTNCLTAALFPQTMSIVRKIFSAAMKRKYPRKMNPWMTPMWWILTA